MNTQIIYFSEKSEYEKSTNSQGKILEILKREIKICKKFLKERSKKDKKRFENNKKFLELLEEKSEDNKLIFKEEGDYQKINKTGLSFKIIKKNRNRRFIIK